MKMHGALLLTAAIISVGVIPVAPARADDGTAARFTRDVGICALAKVSRASHLLSTLPLSNGDAEIEYAVLKSRCLSARGAELFGSDRIRAVVAEALVQRDLNATGTPSHRLESVFVMPSERAIEDLKTGTRANVRMIALGSCVAREDPADAAALLRSSPEGSGERGAFERLGPAMGKCVPATSQVTMDRARLRGFIAEGLYRNAASAPLGRG